MHHLLYVNFVKISPADRNCYDKSVYYLRSGKFGL